MSIKKRIRSFEKMGFEVQVTRGMHLRLKNKSGIFFTGCTPSDRKADLNFLKIIERKQKEMSK